MQGYKNCVDVGSRADGKFVNWEYRVKLDKAARSGAKAKLEVAKVRAMTRQEWIPDDPSLVTG